VYRYVCHRCGNLADAQDITQATFVNAFRKLHQFSASRSFRGWLYAIARTRTIDLLRKRRGHEPLDAETLSDSRSPAVLMEERDNLNSLWALARKELSGDCFELLWLRYQEDLPIADIARILRRTQTGVKVALFRARQRLARHLREARSVERAPVEHARNQSLASDGHQSMATP
jgi:RNA polymerase sigma-70 factor (ECF subfamily)